MPLSRFVKEEGEIFAVVVLVSRFYVKDHQAGHLLDVLLIFR